MGKRKNDGRNAGHNVAQEDVLNGTAQRQLKAIIERIERSLAERDEIMEHIREVFAEAKGNGFDVPTLRKVIRVRKMDPAKLAEETAMIDIYLAGLGSIPAFEAAAEDDDPDGVG